MLSYLRVLVLSRGPFRQLSVVHNIAGGGITERSMTFSIAGEKLFRAPYHRYSIVIMNPILKVVLASSEAFELPPLSLAARIVYDPTLQAPFYKDKVEKEGFDPVFQYHPNGDDAYYEWSRNQQWREYLNNNKE
jgi:hypothetical protein